ncbi:S-layer homology domain-containing protein [Paenibacillus sp. 481]|uniref:S-layer homology domain-containing protein n=1 Tax=Paenibacillus sp. 481 TaxID=2835869 RepID=UPI001E51D3A7|nr:S-layer homology domain-containing protein [Paenibacillus sp. 481]UHA74914.1 S-layer homology domain-containing protein [Paenibacillus sp. 481]
MVKNNIRSRIILLLVFVLVWGSFGSTPFVGKVEAAPEQKIIGGQLVNGVQDPLKIAIKNDGAIAAYLWQDSHYVYQYYREFSWGTNLFYTESGATKRHYSTYFNSQSGPNIVSAPFGEGVITTPDANTIVTTWALDGGNIELKQKAYYPPNARYYEKEWSVENKSGTKTYSDLKLIHGGDATFGGEDNAMSYWDPLLNMVYVKNNNMNKFGLMGFAGKNTTPADKYYSGPYTAGNDQASKGNLSNTSNSAYADAGYHLQWNNHTLRPNQKWVIQSSETWTTAGALQVIAPASKTTTSNSTVSYVFKLQNFQPKSDVFNLNVASSKGWNTVVRGAQQVTVPGNGAIQTVTVDLIVPPGADGLDTLTLTGISQTDANVKNSSNVVTTINNALPAISNVSAQPDRVVNGTARTVPVNITTSHVADGAAVQVELVDGNKRPISIPITADGVVNANRAVVSVAIPSSLNTGTYYFKVTVAGVIGSHSTTLFTVTNSDNADLLDLAISPGQLAPAFKADITDYTASVTNDVYSVTVTGTVYDSNAILNINGVPVASGQASEPIKLQVGENTITVQTTASDGVTKKTYTIRVRKEASGEADLLKLAVAPGTLSPAFTSSTKDYTVRVESSTEQLAVTDIVYSPNSTISVTGATYNPQTGYMFPLQVGENEIEVVVTAQDGITKKVYKIKAYRPSKQSEVSDAARELSIGYGAGDSWESVTKHIQLPLSGKHGTTVTWTSSDPAVLTSSGGVHPSPERDTTVILTAVVEKDGVKVERTFLVIVKKASLQIVSEKNTRTVPIRAGEGQKDVEQVVVSRKVLSDGTKIDKVIVDANKAQSAQNQAKDQKASSMRVVVTEDPNDQANETAVEVPIASYSQMANTLDMTIETSGVHLVLAKATLHQLQQDGSDLFFRFVPIRNEQQQSQLKQQAASDPIVKQAAGSKVVNVVGTPMVIETNYTARETKLVFPLDKLNAPKDVASQANYLQSLHVYIQHSDGSKQLKQGVIDRDSLGNIVGLSIVIDKFSTFTIVKMDTPPSTGSGNSGSDSSDAGSTVTLTTETSSVKHDKQEKQQVEHLPYIKGYPDGLFRPEHLITRAELAAMLWRISKDGKQAGVGAASSTASFDDVTSSHWAFAAIEELKAKGILLGVSASEFEPNRTLTRAEFTAIASRWMQLKASKAVSFADVQEHWAAKEIAALHEANVIQGYKDNQFRPNANVTRAEVVKMVNRLLKRGPLLEVTKPTWSDVQAKHWAYGDIEEASRVHTAERLPEQGERYISK